ncbi:histidine phosphatase family protein [Paenibacillus eucommiae]|uniref:2,3-bisphosphoglycerate-dependent phosphoglycerate mutase n=1 Tax=Paenibacillus eucommiae TaxID=1355755 RepID=A0ABS4IP96_9BACL|nr:histidine phosphatase family protein [Paenibacillus eucommiae]MBP1989338.1 2,3-bisphosphoglycerate-dependent phosphoglycerate mutase [Paenibacillus eucommiae]
MVVVNNQTIIYFVRHAESLYVKGKERSRGLTAKGIVDSKKIKDILMQEEVDILISSSFERAIQTIRALSLELNKEILLEEDLRERQLSGEDFSITDFMESKRMVFENQKLSFPGGESSEQAQERAVKVLQRYMEKFNGKRMVIGTHGDIMTLMMSCFDSRFNFDFWKSTTMPDIYKLEFNGDKLVKVSRLWK